MSWKKKTMDGTMPNSPVDLRPGDLRADPEIDPVLEQALKEFRANAHAWSKAAYNRPWAKERATRSGWRPALAWALGCVLVAGGLSGTLYERHHREVAARLAEQAREAQQRKLAAQQQRTADEDLLAAVDSDISRDVPAAMEPLAQLMDDDAAQ